MSRCIERISRLRRSAGLSCPGAATLVFPLSTVWGNVCGLGAFAAGWVAGGGLRLDACDVGTIDSDDLDTSVSLEDRDSDLECDETVLSQYEGQPEHQQWTSLHVCRFSSCCHTQGCVPQLISSI